MTSQMAHAMDGLQFQDHGAVITTLCKIQTQTTIGRYKKTFEGAYGEWSFDHRHGPSFYGGAQTFYILPNGVSSVQTDDYHVKLKNSISSYQRTIRRNENGDANTFINGDKFYDGWNSYKVKRYFNGTTYFYINDNYRGKNTNNS